MNRRYRILQILASATVGKDVVCADNVDGRGAKAVLDCSGSDVAERDTQMPDGQGAEKHEGGRFACAVQCACRW